MNGIAVLPVVSDAAQREELVLFLTDLLMLPRVTFHVVFEDFVNGCSLAFVGCAF